ncbi:MAG TPA: hypothetical protein VEF03_01750 [Candidatus Binataceae bacterium]|nr:hypothetical protein [Candidatus Binataceae bacterium]
MPTRAVIAIAIAIVLAAGCPRPAPKPDVPERFASAEQVEENFRGRTFILGDNATVALVRPPDWPKDRTMKLPFWFGINVMVPGALMPKEGDYYVISEARLVKPLETPGEWMIEAGSSLIKRETVFVTTKTKYIGDGKILPTIVQFVGTRTFKTKDGSDVQVPILREVSLPAKWTLGGGTPATYARYRIE